MATRKQKRQIMAQRHADFMADVRASGLRAQAKDREYRARKAAQKAEEEASAQRGESAKKASKKIRGKKE